MPHRLLAVALLALAALPFATQGEQVASPPAPDLARRCNAIAWEEDPGSADLVPPRLRAIAAELRARGPAALDDIRAGLPHSLNLRRIAPEVVAEWPGDKSRAALLDLARDPDDEAAAGACFALGAVGGVEVLPGLLVATGSASARVRHDALNALDALGAQHHAADIALKLLGDPDAAVQRSAIALLGNLTATAWIGRAIALLSARAATTNDHTVKEEAEAAVRVLRARRR